MAVVKDLMNPDVASIDHESSVLDAALLMKKRNVSCLVVTKNKKPSGIITERDLVRRIICEEKSAADTKTGEVMSTPLIAVSPLMSLEEAADVLNKGKIKKLGVVSGDKLEGVITATDILVGQTKAMKVLERYVDLLSK
jgi:CBS domain-containing protein